MAVCSTAWFITSYTTHPILIDLGPYSLILASQSPRRQELLRGLELPFTVRSLNTDESFPENLKHAEIAEYLARIKGLAFGDSLSANEIVVTADTIVWIDGKVLNKPGDEAEAIEMINQLNGKKHDVITGVSLRSSVNQVVFHDVAQVHFAQMAPETIAHYVRKYKPYDKAGAYGIQEWIGYVGIERLEGSFYTVMGFPTHKFYVELQKFIAP